MTQTQPATDAPTGTPRQTLGFFAIIGPGRRPVGERIAGVMTCGPALREDDDFGSLFTAAAPVRLRAPQEAISDDCEECGRIGFFSGRGALMVPTKMKARTAGERMSLDGVRVIDGT